MQRHWPPIVLLLIAVLAAPARAQEGVHWGQDLEAAKAQAKQDGRLVLIHFWTTTCAPCLALENNVFNQPGVGSAIEQQFVPVKLNADENSATAQWFGITRVPTDVVVTADGQLVGKLVSPPTPMGYVAEVTAVARKYTTRGNGQTFAQAASQGPVQPQINAAYANLQLNQSVPLASAPALGAATTPPSSTPSFMTSGQSPVGQDRYALATPSSPAIAMPPAGGNSWSGQAPAAGATISAQAPSVQPNQVTNPYMNATPPAPSQQAPPPAIGPTQPSQLNFGALAGPLPTLGAPAGPSAPPQAQAPVSPPVMPPTVAPQSVAPTAATPADARQLPAGAPPLGFEGYCPVSMRNTWKWIPGDPRFGIVHRGRTYWFASQNEQQQFWTDPDKYTPALSGMDPVLAIDHQQEVPGKREHSIDYDGLFYMFASEATLQQFTANPQHYATSARQAMGIPRGRLVR